MHHRLEQLARLEHRVHEPRDRRLAVEPAQQRLQQRRLARSDLAGDHDEPGLALDAVAQIARAPPGARGSDTGNPDRG